MNGHHKVKEKIDKNTPETYSHRVIFMEMMSDIPISSNGPKRNNVHISAKRRKEMQLTSESSSPQTTQSGMNKTNKLRLCIVYRSIEPERMKKFPKKRVAARW